MVHASLVDEGGRDPVPGVFVADVRPPESALDAAGPGQDDVLHPSFEDDLRASLSCLCGLAAVVVLADLGCLNPNR